MSTFKDNLNSYIIDANNFTDIAPVLKYFSIQLLKEFALNQVKNMSPEDTKTMYYNAYPMDKILPQDVCQYILKFDAPEDVNRKWNQLIEINETNELREKYKSIENEQLLVENGIKYDKNKNSTWIVTEHRCKLHPIEEELGYKECLYSVADAMEKCENNDRILVHPAVSGHYQGLSYDPSIDKNIQIIGVGNDVTISGLVGELTKNAYLYFENIIFAFDDDWDSNNKTCDTIVVNSGCKLMMKNCTLIDVAIKIDNGADLEADNCSFIDTTRPIQVQSNSNNITIINCIFTNCGEDRRIKSACIMVEGSGRDDNGQTMNLRCEGNVFENNKWYPIMNYSSIDNFNEKVCLKHNKIVGKDFDPNKMYRVGDEERVYRMNHVTFERISRILQIHADS